MMTPFCVNYKPLLSNKKANMKTVTTKAKAKSRDLQRIRQI